MGTEEQFEAFGKPGVTAGESNSATDCGSRRSSTRVLQPTQIALGTTQNATNLLDLDYTYGTTANNGNVLSQTITVPTAGSTPGFTAVQNYSYDQLNRLQQADEKPQGWRRELHERPDQVLEAEVRLRSLRQ